MFDLKTEYTKAKRALFDKVYGERLNPEQCRAVFTVKGPLLVLAGAGSGKTTVLVNRIAYLIRYGNAYFSDFVPDTASEETVEALSEACDLPAKDIEDILPEFITEPCPPWNVLAITFTNKAANEMKSRLAAEFEDKSVTDAIWAGTFHSVCLRILRKYGDLVGCGSGFSIYDADDSKRMMIECMKELEIDEKRLSPKVVQTTISRAKDNLLTADEIETTADPRSRDIQRIYALYTKKLSANNAVDFDDIIMKTVTLLNNYADVREYYQRKFRYVLVDEYQDTNKAQFVLTSILAGGEDNIMVVGDDDQSIYRFRGATIENILNFDKTYRHATVVKLEQNYRSTETILDAANSIIKRNDDRHEKSLWCDKGKGELITLRELYDQNEESRYIIDKISSGVRNQGRKYSDYAILYRLNELSRSLESAFAKSAVPYRLLGGTRFYDRKEIKDMIAYLSVINSPSDTLRLKRIINEPKRKIGTATVEAVEDIAASLGVPPFEVLRSARTHTALAKSADKLESFVSLIEGVKGDDKLPSDIILDIFEKSGYREMLEGEGFEGEGKINNVNELVSGAMEYEKRCTEAGTPPTLSGYLEEISLFSDVDKYDAEADAVVLMTIHSAKGLEFPVVFLAGLEDGIFPSEQNMQSPMEMSEERRLAYVAVTRAKDKLFVTHTKNRMMYGRTAYNRLSCFIREEVPKSLIDFERPLREPPRSYAQQYSQRNSQQTSSAFSGYKNEVRRAPDTVGAKPRSGAGSFGIVKLEVGTRVKHTMFGEGEIVSAKDMGGDVLYEVRFDTAGTKKLMATFAKLTKIERNKIDDKDLPF